MSQNIQTLNEQNVDNVQYSISRDHPEMKLRGTQEETAES
jgi:hypothetical protein